MIGSLADAKFAVNSPRPRLLIRVASRSSFDHPRSGATTSGPLSGRRRFAILTSGNGARFLPRFLPALRRKSPKMRLLAGRTLVQHFARSNQRDRRPRTTYHSPGTSSIAGADRMVMRFLCRVTTALRSGSDAAHSQRISRISLRSTSLAPAKLSAWEHPTASA